MVFSHLFLIKIPDGIWNLNRNSEIDDFSFPTKDIFIPIACHLARGGLPCNCRTFYNDIYYLSILNKKICQS